MITICYLNNKGGVGKTATVSTIGHMMNQVYGKKVLMIDLDPQGNLSTGYSEIDWVDIFLSILNGKEVDTEKSVEDILMHPEMDVHEAIKHTQYEGLDVIPSHLTLSTVEESLKADITMPQQFKLKGQLEKVKDEYDYCLIDCSPSISILNINGLVAADEVYIPLRCDGNSCIGMAITMNLIRTIQTYNPALQLMGCFLTQYDGRKNVAKTVYELLKNILTDDIILPFRIGTTKYLEENTFEQKPLLAVDSGKNKCSATLSYLKLTEYMIAPNKKEYLKKYDAELKEIENLRLEEEQNMA